MTLAWNAVTNSLVAGYNIYYGGASGNYTNKTSTGMATTLTISNLANGVTYYFAATTYSAAGAESAYSAEVAYTVPTVVTNNQPPTLNPISNLTITENAGTQTVNLSGISSGASNEIQTLTVTAASSNAGLIPNPTVNYTSANTTGSLTFAPAANATGLATVTVTVNDGGTSNNIDTQTFTVTVNADTQPPTVPATVVASAASVSQINLKWAASTDNVGVTGYVVQRSQGAGSTSFTQIATPTGTNYSDTALTASTTYNYRVEATDAAGNLSGYSSVVTATTLAPDTQAPSAPANLVATTVNSSQVNLSWTASTDNVGVTGYLVERENPGATNFAQIGTNNGTSYADSSLAANSTYSYRVRATDAAGNLSGYSGVASATTPSGLVAAYGFDEGTGTTVMDASGNGNNGTISGATWTSGKYGNALVFNGTSALVTIPNATILQLSTAMTLEAWVNPSTVSSAWRDVIYKGNDNYYLEGTSMTSGEPAMGGTFASNPLYGTTALAVNTWTHLAVTYDGTTMRFYVNGTQVSSAAQTGAIATSTNSLQIGGDSIYGQFFQGTIDEVHIYNVALTAAQIQTDMNTPINVTTNVVNQSPTLNPIGNLTINENAGAQSVSLAGISDGAGDSGQTLTVTTKSSNTGLIPNPSVTYTSPNATGSLAFTPVANTSGSATVTVTVNDGGANNNTVTQTFTVTVNPVNQSPTLNPIGNLTINENAGAQSVSLAGISDGAGDSGQTLTVTTKSSNTGLIPNPSVTYTSPNATGSLAFTPVANASGSATVTVTVNDGGANNNTVTQTFTVTVNPVNQSPTLNPIGNLTINENAGAQSVSLAGISDGAGDSGQTLTVTTKSSNTGLIPNPSVTYTSPNATGSLAFTPVANASGSATVTVTVNDGGANNNTVTQTFTVTVNPVNQSPTLNPISNLTINENGGAQTVNLSGVSDGVGDSGQTLTITAKSSNTSLIPNPTITYTSPNTTGSLAFTPAANASGSATITVTGNDGGATNNTVTQTFTVTVNPVNQPPTLNPISNLTIYENAGGQTVNLSGISSGAANEKQTLTVTAVSSNSSLIPNPTIKYTSPGTTGSLTFTPVADANGAATITVTVNDGGASNNVVTQTFTITVNPVNQPPTLNPISSLTINENAGTQTVNLSGISDGVGDQGQTLAVTAVSSNSGLIPNPTVNYTSPNATGSLIFTPVAGASGSATVTVTVNDGAASNNLASQVFTVTVNSIVSTNNTGPIDQTPPTISLVSPTSNLNTTNGVITATGKAKDNVGVSSVYYSLNGSGWTLAATTNNWTNWTASLTLTPGTNTLQSYAVDGMGNISTTNLVSFQYVVLMPLTVVINGNGSVSPNDNGKLLAVNESYTVSAKASSGFGFTNWTGGSAGKSSKLQSANANAASVVALTSTSTKLQFIMTSNLTLTANFLDTARPTVSIVSPTSNKHATNGSFTVTGKAGDNVAVSNVFYSLNGSSWATVATTNNWANWTASLTLVPGTNTLQAYAVDTSGNVSKTNTVRFEYVVLMPLTVAINGNGHVSPNYNGKLLAINEGYTMTAHASAGFAFTNWTGGIATNSAKLRFIMMTNLTLTANFVDVARPTVSIVSPTSNLHTTNGSFTVAGKAKDNVGVAAVYYSLNSGAWTNATTTNNWSNWTTDVKLTPGTNTLQAYAVDTVGNFSTTNIVRFEYIVEVTPLIVNINGNGTVSPNYNGELLPINEGFNMTAKASSGFAFSGWTGSIKTNGATLRFTMTSNLTFTANFVDVQPPTVSIVSPTSNQHTTNSAFTVTGKASDNVAVASVYYSLNSGTWTNASTTNVWANWTAGVTLTPGTNTLQACAVDTSNNHSTTNTVRFEYVVPVANVIAAAEPVANFTPIVSAPTPAVVSPPILPATLTPGGFANGQYFLTVTGTTNVQYIVQATTNLVDWIPVQTNTAPFDYTDTEAGNFNHRYYRAVSVPTPLP